MKDVSLPTAPGLSRDVIGAEVLACVNSAQSRFLRSR
jgi:hypothetical protein